MSARKIIVGTSVALLLAVGTGSAYAAPEEGTGLVERTRKCTFGLLFDADRLTCDLAIIVNP